VRKSLAACLAVLMTASQAFGIGLPKGFDGKVYKASMALYGTLPKGTVFEDDEVQSEDVTHFLCTVTAFKKVKGGYALIGAGHCTADANPNLPKDLVYSVSENIGEQRTIVQLLKAKVDETSGEDFAVYILKSDKNIKPIAIGSENEVNVGAETVDVNFSLGERLTKQLSKGYISSIIAEKGKIKGFYLVTQFDSHGASGSAVVSEKTHKIIGLVIGGYDGSTTPTICEPISRIATEIQMVLPNESL
jgi:trypsin-like peptidase